METIVKGIIDNNVFRSTDRNGLRIWDLTFFEQKKDFSILFENE